ncbi:MAG: N-acetyltransferase family protein [Blastocatellia bacterium]
MIQYRKGLVADAPVITDFQLCMARETEDMELDPAVCAQGVLAVFANPALGEYYVAENDGQVIGSLMITYEWSDWRNGMVWWIQSVYVIPELRGRGVYAGLYACLRDIAVQAGARGIRLYVDRRNTRAQQVYARLGMNGEHYHVFEWMNA